MDTRHTTWAEAQALLQSGGIVPEEGFLEIGGDGQFAVKDLPNFSLEHMGPIDLHWNASGRWRTGYDRMNERAYLWLKTAKVNEELTDGITAMALFLYQDDEYFLHVTIGDPDSADALVLRKMVTDIEGARGHQ